MDEQEKLARATRQVDAMEGFFIHLGVFLIVIVALFVINLVTGPGWWVQWVFLGWGVGVLAHALTVFGRASQLISEWRARKIDQIKARL
jgi:hypothetical protein